MKPQPLFLLRYEVKRGDETLKRREVLLWAAANLSYVRHLLLLEVSCQPQTFLFEHLQQESQSFTGPSDMTVSVTLDG